MKVCLDAGHGGKANGASANNIIEDAWALEFVGRIGHHIRAKGGETVLTRTKDKAVGLARRGRIAVDSGSDLFISIHCNSSTNREADGAEVFYAPVGGYQNNSIGVGRELIAACVDQGLDSRGVRDGSSTELDSRVQDKRI